MLLRRLAGFPLTFQLLSLALSDGQSSRPKTILLKADEVLSGPVGRQKSGSCLRVYAGGEVIYTKVAGSANATSSGRPVASAYHLIDTDLWELSSLLKSKAVKKLAENFGPPHKPIDYFEKYSVEIRDDRGNSKKLFTREYYVADLEEKTRYPSALIVLMDRIGKIEEEAANSGKKTEIPADCSLGTVDNALQ